MIEEVLCLPKSPSHTERSQMPDLMKNANTLESKLLINILNDHPPFQFENIDQKIFMKLVALHRVHPLIFLQLANQSPAVPKEIYEDLKSQYLSNIYSNKIFLNEFLRINEAFNKKNVPLLPLKGVDMLMRFYPFHDQRSMSDIDILIMERDLEQVERIFIALGYTKDLEGLRQEYWLEHQCHIPFQNDEIKVDVHFGLDFKRKHRVLLPDLWIRAGTVDVNNQKARLFSPEDALFSFALHWRRFGNILTLKQVLDVARLIKGPPAMDWDYVKREAERGKIKATLFFILMQAHLFCGTEIPKNLFGKLGVPWWQKILIKNFILKHTFEIRPSEKINYLKAHLLLYDNPWEPLLYLLHIPYEQFCRFYALKPYTPHADLRYRWRVPYMVFSFFKKARIL